ncbi:MAG TPA: Coagulation factor 5/8 type domain-containing protein [Solirubrobacteraceae bacterium]|nr:Coagulation factor 5/8 type domain-containing protein [Solirubrobacteraceae bacterium]
MRRLPLLALALSLAVAAPAAAQDDSARYALVHGCYALQAPSGKLVAKDATGAYRATAGGVGEAEPFRMQATRLGQYLLYGRARDFMSGGDAGVRSASAPDGTADWRVDVAGDGFRLTLPDAGGRALGLDGDRLRLVSGAGERWRFVQAEGCPAYPEVELNATGQTQRHPTALGEVRGTVDAHMHQMAFEFIGGSVHCGRPWHPYGVEYALVDCPDHATGIAPLETALKGKERHDPVGWPTFRDWPDDRSLTHESSYYKWVERAWMGGLRVFTNLLVDNGVLCEVYPLKRNSCDEMATVRLEAKRMFELQDYIDAQWGGPGKGWYRIVRDPFEARRVISEGKLAVIMGIEVSRLFDCTIQNRQPECTREDIDRQLGEVYDMGVRQMELINKFDNAFGGVAGDSGDTGLVTNTGNRYETGQYWDMRTCDGPAHAHDREQHSAHNEDNLIANGIAAFVPPGTAPVYPAPPHCNAYGLTELGAHLVNRMIDRGMIVDPDHLSVLARNQLLDVVEARDYSGVVSSHSWSTPDSYPRIYRVGGVITPYAGDSESFVQQWRETKPMRGDKRFYFGFGYGADMNGFGSQGGPRGANVPNPVTYPFKSFVGDVTFDKQRSGERVYDVNVEGVDHYGLYPDWIEDLRKLAGDEIVEDMARGAEAYLQMWERAVGVPAMECRGAHLGFTARGLGGVELGAGPERVLRRATQPRRRAARTWEWCVEGDDKGTNLTARTMAVFTPEGTVGLVASDARTHVAKGVHRGTRARRARLRTRAFGKGVRVRRAARGSDAKLVYVLRGGRVRYVAVATGEASRDRATLRRYLRLTGLG